MKNTNRKKSKNNSKISVKLIVVTALLTSIFTAPIGLFLGLVNPFALDIFYKPLEPELNIELDYVIIKRNMDSNVWEGLIKFSFINMENKKSILHIPQITFNAPNINKFNYHSQVNKYIDLSELQTKEDSIIFSLEHSFKILNPDSQLYPYRIKIRFSVYYPTGNVAKNIEYDSGEQYSTAFHYEWPMRSRKDYYFLTKEYEAGNLHDNWKLGEIYYKDKKYKYFYLEPDFRFKIVREGEIFKIIIPNMTSEIRKFTKQDKLKLAIYRVKIVPDPQIEDKFPELTYHNMPLSRTIYKKNEIYTDHFNVRMEEGFDHYVYVIHKD